MLNVGLLRSTTASFPFWIFQAVLGGGALAWAALYVQRHPSLRRVWIGYGLFLAAVGFAGRAFNDNHWGFVGMALVVGFLLRERGRVLEAARD
jgi:hypothetical protein